MKLQDAYKKALKDELQPLVDAGKLTLLGTVEDLAVDLLKSTMSALKNGAKMSEDKWDDVLVSPAVDFLESRALPFVDKIDGEQNQ